MRCSLRVLTIPFVAFSVASWRVDGADCLARNMGEMLRRVNAVAKTIGRNIAVGLNSKEMDMCRMHSINLLVYF